MSAIEKTKKELKELCKNKFMIYELDYISKDLDFGQLPFKGSLKDFFLQAEKMDAKTIYFGVAKSGEEYEEHKGEGALLIIGFFADGLFHSYQVKEAWAEEPPPSQKKDVKSVAKKYEEFIRKNYPDEVATLKFQSGYNFWKEAGFNYFGDDEPFCRRVEREVQAKITAEVREAEDKKMSELIEKCVAWAHTNNFGKLSRQDAATFLVENGTVLTMEGVRKLWLQASHKLKTG